MIYGNIGRNGDLILPIRLLDANGHVHRVEAAVDTGFDGHVSLPNHLAAPLGMPYSESVEMTLAADVVINVDVYEGVVIWRGQRRPVKIVEAEGTPLVGLALMWDSLLTAEITENGAVTVGPLPDEASG